MEATGTQSPEIVPNLTERQVIVDWLRSEAEECLRDEAVIAAETLREAAQAIEDGYYSDDAPKE